MVDERKDDDVTADGLDPRDLTILALKSRIAELEGEENKLGQAFRDLAQARGDYDALIERANDAILILDTVNEEVLEANALACRTYGFSREEFLGMSFKKLTQDVHRGEEYLSDVLHNSKGEDFETVHYNRNGDTLVMQVNASAIEFRGKHAVLVINRDVTHRRRMEREARETLERIRKAMGGVIQAMALTVERRDPYTAGHQRRVADLARTIATTLELDVDTIDTIRMAGAIHDLGKISIPAELLSKPGRLNSVEFDLIKTHSEVGYDILKTIDFPWPIADVVYQHHERIDGSGYPQGLTGEQINIGARVIAVTDVVEAMASHRPYRAALGIEAALNEIRKNRGRLYDPEVVDACLGLFESGYEF